MSDVEKFYDKDPHYEWDRLERNRTEFAVTLQAFKEHIPQPPVRIMDIGGGPGRYSIALAQKGYEVILVDLSRSHLEFAKEKAGEAGVSLAGYVRGNAIDLQFQKEQVDVVLLMGPLYHLLTARKREKAVSEAFKILKGGGLIFASFVTNYAPIRWVGKYEPGWITQFQEQCEQLVAVGRATHPFGEEHSFLTYTWFAHPAEVTPLMEQAGFEPVDLIACEGIISMIDEKVNELTGKEWELWVDLNYKLGKDPTVHGAAEHLLYVGRKKKSL